VRIAFAMFAVGWGANQFSPMLIVYRHELRLTAGEVAGLFLVYALTLIPGLLIGGPASDRLGRRAVVWPFVALSPAGHAAAGARASVTGHDRCRPGAGRAVLGRRVRGRHRVGAGGVPG
jgi:MFS family permease